MSLNPLNFVECYSTKGTAGVFWMNAAETWVDIYNRNSEKNVLSSIVNMVSGSDKEPLASHFISESGIVDTFILLGESPLNTFKQYTDLTGAAPLPQHAALAYHQSRWNYNDERDVTTVSENFDVHDIPMDTVRCFDYSIIAVDFIFIVIELHFRCG